jgi:hypothetical protein
LFNPGEAVELQFRIEGRNVSRYYTPINGAPSSFEIFIKMRETGVLSPTICAHRPGDRQYKIRGILNLCKDLLELLLFILTKQTLIHSVVLKKQFLSPPVLG